MSLRLKATWLTEPATKAVISALERARPGCARFVGGCVRNVIMKRPVSDIDIATQLKPEETLAALEAASIRAIPTGIEHGTVTAVVDHKPFEITSLRRDVETDGRRAVVSFTDDWAEDAGRRDFRLNALYLSPQGEVFDPTGGGYDDALAGHVIFIGDGDTRLREDYLRILRFFRFNAWYGQELDKDGLAACARQTDGLSQIARERLWTEFKKLLASPHVDGLRDSLAAMKRAEVLDAFMPANVTLDGVDAVLFAEQGGAPHDDPMRRLMGLLRDDPASVFGVSEALRLSNAEAKRLSDWASPEVQGTDLSNRGKLHQALYWHGQETVLDLAGTRGMTSMYFYSDVHKWQKPEFPLTGDDALAAGLKGPEIGDALRRVEREWVERGFDAVREELLDKLHA